MNKWIVLPAYQKNGGESNIFSVGERREEKSKGYESYSIKADVNGLENARLVASAPELLDALRQIEGMCNMPEVKRAMMKHEQAYYHEVMNAAREAISKAEG